jgi:hypothetical protein
MNWKTALLVIAAVVLAGFLGLSLVRLIGDRAGRLEGEGAQPSGNNAAREHLASAMEQINQSLEVSEVVRGGPELVGAPIPFATYTVRVIQEPPKEIYFFDLQEYTIDIGSGAETGRLCEKVAAAVPQKKESTGSEVLDQGEVSVGIGPIGVQAPASAYWNDLGRILGIAVREGKFSRLEILVKGFADGTISKWKLGLEAYPYDFHEIHILPQLDPKSSRTPRRFASAPSKFLIGDQYSNEDLGNLRAAFVMQDIVDPMLTTCLKELDVEVEILEGYTSRHPRNPLQRKVEVYLLFYE